MKLKNKRTGEIIDIYKGEITLHYNQGRKTIHFKSLEELDEWEDYEEPKKHHYYIETTGRVIELIYGDNVDELKEELNKIGNYFSSREEAEKAVEKLKAWKRLRDEGMRTFSFKRERRGIDLDYYTLTILAPRDKDSLDLLFGGEE